jgi:hypothetical protein
MPEQASRPLGDLRLHSSVGPAPELNIDHELGMVKDAGTANRGEFIDEIGSIAKADAPWAQEIRDEYRKFAMATDSIAAAAGQYLYDLDEIAQRTAFVPAQGITQLREAARLKLNESTAEARSRAEASVAFLEAKLLLEAAPKIETGREAFDREEFKVFLDNSKDPLGAVMQVVQSQDPDDKRLAAIAVSSFGRTALKARAGADANTLRAIAVAAALSGMNDRHRGRQTAARALNKIGKLRASIGAFSSAASMAGERRS